MVTSPMSLKQREGFTPLPPGISLDDARNLSPDQLNALRNQRKESLNSIRKSYERIIGRQLTDADFEKLMNDPEFQGRLSGQEEMQRKKRLESFNKAKELARWGGGMI